MQPNNWWQKNRIKSVRKSPKVEASRSAQIFFTSRQVCDMTYRLLSTKETKQPTSSSREPGRNKKPYLF